MNGMTMGQKIRWIAGGLYLFLALYQLACVHGTVVSGTLADTGIVSLLAIVLAVAAAGMAVWMFSSKNVLDTGAHRAVIVGTIFAVCYELLTYSGQAPIIQKSWELFTGSGDRLPGLALGILVFVRLLVLILAAFFVCSSRPAYEPEAEEAEVLEVDEAEVDTEAETRD